MTTQKAEQTPHTPTPWRLTPMQSGGQKMILGGNSDRYIATIQIHQTPRMMGRHAEATREANAAFIVECVNAHAQLVAENERLKGAIKNYLNDLGAYGWEISDQREEELKSALNAQEKKTV